MKVRLLLCAAALSLTACGSQVPKCSDEETIDLVKEIANEEMEEQVGAVMAKQFSYTLQSIRTTDENEKTGAYNCAAELLIEASNGAKETGHITYTVEKTDKGDEFYVTVQGL